MPEYRMLGRPVARVEGTGKVTGRTVYAADLQLPGMLHAKLVRSPYAHARIRSIDTSRARAVEGVEAVVTAQDLPPTAGAADSSSPSPTARSNRGEVLLAAEEVVFAGEPVVAVIARDEATAEEARDLVQVDYEELPAVLDPIEAMKEGSPLARSPLGDVDRSESRGHVTLSVEEKETQGKPSNVSSQARFTRGDTEKGFTEADVIAENTWRSAITHQGYIEPHVTVADYDAASGELTVWTATQGQFFVRDQISKTLRLAETKVRVIGMELGGGFGGKIVLTQVLCAALALIVKRPLKLVLTRAEDLIGATPSPQAVVELKTGMNRDGDLTALRARLIYDSGAYPGAPAAIGAILIGGYYRCPNLHIEAYEVLTNKVSVGALRAPGAPQATFAIESHMDIMARELGLDPLEVRLKNAAQEGDPMPSGMPYSRIGLRECLKRVRESDLWRQRDAIEREANGKRRGIGLAAGGWLGGLQPAAAVVALNGDGTFSVTVGANDITGTNTSFAQIAAEELGQPLDRIHITTADTDTAPFAGMSAGSKTLFTVGRAVRAAAEDARQQALAIAGERLEVSPDELEMAAGDVRVKGSPDRSLSLLRLAGISTGFGAQYPPVVGRGQISARRQAPGFSVQVAEVEVDAETGTVAVLRHVTAQDVGFAINPMSVEGQMEGGTAQGIGLGLFEEMLYDERGRLLNPGLLDYRMPTAADAPPIESLIVEVPSEDGPYGARGVGEPPIVPTSAAIANAVFDAVGARVTEVPITPERVLRALGKVSD